MCRGISAVVLQRGNPRVLFRSGINSHSDIRATFGIADTKDNEQVNLEALPHGDFLNIDDWKIHVDHDVPNIPQWFLEDKLELENILLSFVEDELKEIKATKLYKGDLNLERTAIKSLPSGLTVGGSLDLRGTAIAELPSGLTFGGYLYLRGTAIKKSKIPKKFKDRCIYDNF